MSGCGAGALTLTASRATPERIGFERIEGSDAHQGERITVIDRVNVPSKSLFRPALALVVVVATVGCGSGPDPERGAGLEQGAAADASAERRAEVADRQEGTVPSEATAPSESAYGGQGDETVASGTPVSAPSPESRAPAPVGLARADPRSDSEPAAPPTGGTVGEVAESSSEASGSAAEVGDSDVGVADRGRDLPSVDDVAEEVHIPAGTRIPAVMGLTLSTRTHEQGDRFYATVSEEILADDGMVLVPEGTRLEGTITAARRSTDPDEEAVLALAFETLSIDGVTILLDAMITEAELETSQAASGTRSALTVVTGAAAGAVLGRILGGDTRGAIQGAAVGAIGGAGIAITTRDGHAVIREGTRLVVRLESAAPLSGSPL